MFGEKQNEINRLNTLLDTALKIGEQNGDQRNANAMRLDDARSMIQLFVADLERTVAELKEFLEKIK